MDIYLTLWLCDYYTYVLNDFECFQYVVQLLISIPECRCMGPYRTDINHVLIKTLKRSNKTLND